MTGGRNHVVCLSAPLMRSMRGLGGLVETWSGPMALRAAPKLPRGTSKCHVIGLQVYLRPCSPAVQTHCPRSSGCARRVTPSDAELARTRYQLLVSNAGRLYSVLYGAFNTSIVASTSRLPSCNLDASGGRCSRALHARSQCPWTTQPTLRSTAAPPFVP